MKSKFVVISLYEVRTEYFVGIVPLNTALYQTEEPVPKVTLPMREALGATKVAGPRLGLPF